MYTMFITHLQYADRDSPPEGLNPSGGLYVPCLSARHLRATLGALFLIAGLTGNVWRSVPATGADTVAARPGGFGAAHPTGPTSAAATSAAAASASTSTTSTHLNHLLLHSDHIFSKNRGGRCAGRSRLHTSYLSLLNEKISPIVLPIQR